MSKIQFTGIMPAMITPVGADGHILKGTVKALVEAQLSAGVTGFYTTGSTGEGVLLSRQQRREMVEAAVEANAGRGKVIAQVGAISQAESVELAKDAAAIGVDGISSIVPTLYFKYNFNEVADYYRKIAEAAPSVPLLLYAQPNGVAADVNRLVEELIAVPNIIGAKDTRANYYQMWRLKQLNGGDINIINGPDEMLICGLCMGADGGIGSTYNLMPERYVRLFNAFRAGDLAAARAEQTAINRIIEVALNHGNGYVIRTIKTSLRLSGYDTGVEIAPAREMTEDEVAAFKRDMLAVGYQYP